MLSSMMYALMGDVVETAEGAAATGIAGMFGYLGGALFTLNVGALANTIGYERCSPFCSCSTSWPQSSCGLLWACEDPALRRNSSSDAPVEPAGWHARFDTGVRDAIQQMETLRERSEGEACP